MRSLQRGAFKEERAKLPFNSLGAGRNGFLALPCQVDLVK